MFCSIIKTVDADLGNHELHTLERSTLPFLLHVHQAADIKLAARSKLDNMTTFADVLPVRQLESHKYSVNLEDEWCIGTGETLVWTTVAIR